MPLTWTTETSLALAQGAAKVWNARVEGHIANSGNSVWLATRDGEPVILRLTDQVYRSVAECEGEIDYVRHLYESGVQVARALPSTQGNVVEKITEGDEEMLASIFTYAPGEYVDATSPHWNDQFFLEWGKSLGKIHAASRAYPPDREANRWLWKEELFLAHARDLIPPNDTESLRELDELMEWFEALPQTPQTFGITHGDFASPNFNYHPEKGITAFDFGNCCRHWYLSDIAISLTVLRRYEQRDRYRELIFEGYREHSSVDSDLSAEISRFFRLRILYVYLSRLMKFGPNPTDEEKKILEMFRGNVHHPFAW